MVVDLDFARQRTAYATHGLHSFAAKFPPQLARWGIESFTRPGETVLDPMVGSGTTLVECRLLGRHGLGADIDPLARLITRVKSTPLSAHNFELAAADLQETLIDQIAKLDQARAGGRAFAETFPEISIPDFPNRDYWFLPEVSEELAILRTLIDGIETLEMREFFYLVFSALIITKSASSVANVRDLAHSRPHFAAPDSKPNVLKMFKQKLTRLKKGLSEFSARFDPDSSARIVSEDARCLPIDDESVDLAFTSPPYVNAIDYPRAHKFSLHWLGDALGTSPDAYRDLGREYIGTDRVPVGTCMELSHRPHAVASLSHCLRRLAEVDTRRAGIARRYFDDMGLVLSEISRVLRPGRNAVVVVCPSRIAEVDVPTHTLLADLAEHTTNGQLRAVETHSRIIDDSKRQLPIVRGRFGAGMRAEYVVVFQKA